LKSVIVMLDSQNVGQYRWGKLLDSESAVRKIID